MQLPIFVSDYANTFPNVVVHDLMRYVIGAGGVYLLINVLMAARLARRKIRSESPPASQILREILASLRTVLVFAMIGTTIVLGAAAGVFRIYSDISELGLPYFLFSVAAVIVLHDAYFYWAHRLMHRPRFFRLLHRLHHRSHNPTPFTAYSFDLGEAVINASFLPLVLLVLPAHPMALLAFTAHMMLRNAIGHCGYEIFPARSDGRPLFGWMTTVTHHDLHHAYPGWNLGLYFTWWDRWMGSEHPQYLERYKVSAPRIRSGQLAGLAAVGALFAVWTLDYADAAERNLSGYWVTPGIGAVVSFEPCRNDKRTTCGRFVWAWSETVARHVGIGDLMIRRLRWSGNGWVNGRLVNPEDGRTYTGSITRVSADVIRLKGCAGIFCKSQDWRSLRSLRQLDELRNLQQ